MNNCKVPDESIENIKQTIKDLTYLEISNQIKKASTMKKVEPVAPAIDEEPAF